MKLSYNQGRAFKGCKNCIHLKNLFFGYHCNAYSPYYSGDGKSAFTTLCDDYERQSWKFWVLPKKSNDIWDREKKLIATPTK